MAVGRRLKQLALALGVVLVVAAVGLGILWMRLTALPDWYESGELVAEDGTPQMDADWVVIPHAPGEPTRYQLRNPHLRPKAKAKAITPAIKGSRAIWADEGSRQELDAGAVINLSQMDLDTLSAKDRASYERAIDAFPALTGRDVYVGIEGEVGRRGDELVLSPKTRLRVGNTSYSLETAAKRLHMGEGELRRVIEKELAKLELHPPEPG